MSIAVNICEWRDARPMQRLAETDCLLGACVSAGAKIGIIPVEKSATLGGRQPGLILEAEEGRMCSGGATWKRLLS
jgi:hypothetical protein